MSGRPPSPSGLLKNAWFAAWGHAAYKISSEIGMHCRPGALTGLLFHRARNRSLLSRSPLTARIAENIGRKFLVEKRLVLRRKRTHWHSDWPDALLRREIFLAPSRINCIGSLMRDERKSFGLKPGSWAVCPPKIGPGAPTKAEGARSVIRFNGQKNTESAPRKASIKFARVMLPANIGGGCRKSEAMLSAA